MIAFTQKDVKEESDKKTFKITYYDSASGSMEEATCAKSDYDYDYGIDDVYTVKQPDTHGYGLTIDPFMDGSFGMDWTVQVFLGDEDVTKDYLEPEDKTFTIKNSDTLMEDLHICIKQNYQNVKVLVITSNN